MRIFLYEFVSGGGWYTQGVREPAASLAAEGNAMLSALATDFARIRGVSVDLTRDARLAHLDFPGCAVHDVDSAASERETISRLAGQADWALVIAPEFDGLLHERLLAVERIGGRLLGPSAAFASLAADKQATAERLEKFGVPVARGIALEPGQALPAEFVYPAVLKPRDGAGSQGIQLIASAAERPPHAVGNMRLERFCPGTAASVALLCGSAGVTPLAPCRQVIDVERGFGYRGGSLPLAPALARRAADLACRAVRALGEARGYLGVDLVLGHDDSGAGDVVIEVNPRMTTSYVGLRTAACENLAACMLAAAQGDKVELCWKAGEIQFEATGEVRSALGES